MPGGQPAWRSSGDSTCTQLRCPNSGDRAGSRHPRVPSTLPQPQDVWAAQPPEATGRCCCLALPLHTGGTSSCSGAGRGNAPREQHELPPGSIFDCCCHMEEDGSLKTELLSNSLHAVICVLWKWTHQRAQQGGLFLRTVLGEHWSQCCFGALQMLPKKPGTWWEQGCWEEALTVPRGDRNKDKYLMAYV